MTTLHGRQMTILHLIPSLVGGGAEHQLAMLTPHFRIGGLRVHVAYLHGGVNLQALADEGAHLHHLPSRGNHDPSVLYHLVRLIKTLQPDVVQTWLTHMDVMGGTAARLTGVPHVVSERSSAAMYGPSWKNRLRVRLGRSAAVVVANSESGREYWIRAGRRGKCCVIRNGVPLRQIASAQPAEVRQLDLAPETRLIVFAGRFSPEKNALTLLDAVSSVIAEVPNVSAVFFGEGPQGDALRQRAALTQVPDRICFPGYTTELWRWLRRATVVACPSFVEGNPNVVMEAMAAGAPLVVSEIAAHRELLDDATAAFCAADRAAEIAAAIRRVLENPAEARLRAAAASSRVDRWSIEVAASRYIGLYESILTDFRGGAGRVS